MHCFIITATAFLVAVIVFRLCILFINGSPVIDQLIQAFSTTKDALVSGIGQVKEDVTEFQLRSSPQQNQMDHHPH